MQRTDDFKKQWQETKVANFKVKYLNHKELSSIKQEIFLENSYSVELDKNNPIIIDLGSHIGLSILYFKMMYPEARIFAFEPNPYLFELLSENIFVNGLEKVEILNSAADDHNGERSFYIDDSNEKWFSNSSFYERGWSGSQVNREIKVKTVHLAQFIDQPIDLLKIDIEGDESQLIYSLSKKLHYIKNIIIEFHNNERQNLQKLLDFLDSKGYSLKFFKDGIQIEKIMQEKLFIIKASK